MRRSLRTSLLLALALAGCTVFEVPPSEPATPTLGLTVSPVGPTRADGLTVRFDWRGGGPITLLVDEVVILPALDASETLVATSTLPDGLHRFRATAKHGKVLVSSNVVDVTLDRTAPVVRSVTPEAGRALTEPFTVSVVFSEPVQVWSAELSTWSSGGGPLTPAVSADGRTVSLQLPLVIVESRATLRVADLAGNAAADVQLGPWYSGDLQLSLEPPLSPLTSIGGVQSISATWVSTGPPALDVRLDGVLLGTLARGGSIPLDTRSHPDGAHRLELGATGYFTWGQDLTFDNTPPVYLRCGGFDARSDDMPVGARAVAYLTDASWHGEVRVELGASPAPASLPAEVELPVPAIQDEAGNASTPTACTLRYPVWRATLGAGPVDFRESLYFPSGSKADAAAFWAYPNNGEFGSYSPYLAVRISRGAESEMWSMSSGGSPWSVQPFEYPSAGPAKTVSEPVSGAGTVAWVDRTAVATQVHARNEVMQGVVAILPAGTVATPVAPGPRQAAWIELDAAGRGRLGLLTGIGAPVNYASDEGDDVTGAALTSSASQPVAYLTVASPAGTPAQLRAAGGGPALNVDASKSASAPAFVELPGHALLAWVEDGRVVVRVAAAGGPWGPATVQGGQPARLPRLGFDAIRGRAVLGFVESRAGGDTFVFQAYDDATGTWSALPELSAEGAVTSLSLLWPGVLWGPADGTFRLRTWNG